MKVKRPQYGAEEYELVYYNCYCVNCGEDKVHEVVGTDDYYEGCTYYCIGCKCEYTMPSFIKVSDYVFINKPCTEKLERRVQEHDDRQIKKINK